MHRVDVESGTRRRVTPVDRRPRGRRYRRGARLVPRLPGRRRRHRRPRPRHRRGPHGRPHLAAHADARTRRRLAASPGAADAVVSGEPSELLPVAVGSPTRLRGPARGRRRRSWPGCARGCTSSPSRAACRRTTSWSPASAASAAPPPHTSRRRGLARARASTHDPGAHAEGSSHGETRIVRQVYFEGTDVRAAAAPYVRAVGASSPTRTASRCCTAPAGCSSAGPTPGSSAAAWRPRSTGTSSTRCSTRRRCTRRFPALRPPDGRRRAVRAAGRRGAAGGAVAAHLRRAVAGGSRAAARRVGRRLVRDRGRRPRRRPRGAPYEAGALVLAPGRWAPELRPARPAAGRRARVQHWFAPPVGRRLPAGAAAGLDLGPRGRHRRCTARRPRTATTTSRRRCTSRPQRPADAWQVDELAAMLGELLPGLGDRHVREVGLLVHADAGRELRGRSAPRVRPRGAARAASRVTASSSPRCSARRSPTWRPTARTRVRPDDLRPAALRAGPARVRLFAAVRPPAEALEHAAAAVDRVRAAEPGPRWVPSERWHLTLAFYGEVAERERRATRRRHIDRRLARRAAD